MACNPEILQAFLDDELSAPERKELEYHLGACRACRQELARLKLLWLELAVPEETALPAEWPYLRHQVLTAVRQQRRSDKKADPNLGKSWGLAWQPALLGTRFIPGADLLSGMTRTLLRELPGSLYKSAGMAGNLWRLVGKAVKAGGNKR